MKLRHRQSDAKSGEWIRVCRAVPPVWPMSAAALIIGDVEAVGQRPAEQEPARSCRLRRRVECLSTFFAGRKLRSRTSPECSIAWVREAVSSRVIPRSTTAMSHAAIW